MRTGLLIIAGCALLFLAAPAHASDVIDVAMSQSPLDLAASEALEIVDVDGIGEVTLSGKRRGDQIIVRAYATSGELLGKAEGTIGLNKTPIYLRSPDGLFRAVLIWPQNQ
ncbi:MAG: hypothetical protein AB8G17_10360 [Gammaproteobacteria bacterium]